MVVIRKARRQLWNLLTQDSRMVLPGGKPRESSKTHSREIEATQSLKEREEEREREREQKEKGNKRTAPHVRSFLIFETLDSFSGSGASHTALQA